MARDTYRNGQAETHESRETDFSEARVAMVTIRMSLANDTNDRNTKLCERRHGVLACLSAPPVLRFPHTDFSSKQAHLLLEAKVKSHKQAAF